MAFRVRAVTLDGETYSIEAKAVDTISQFRQNVAAIVGRSDFKLVTEAGSVLQTQGTLVGAFGLGEGSVVQIVFQRLRIVGTRSFLGIGGAFAAVKGDGSVVTWGHSYSGGDCSAVQPQLVEIQDIYSTAQAFAAVKQDGSVVTWGDSDFGGDCSAVQRQLVEIQDIYSTAHAFAAVKRDGSVVTWGQSYSGGDCSAVQRQLVEIQDIYSTAQAFAAVKRDGSVVTWGRSNYGGDCSAVRAQLDVPMCRKQRKRKCEDDV